MKIIRWISSKLATALASLVFFSIVTISCKESVSAPDTSPPFLTPPGARLTQGGDATQIGWYASGTKIAFESQNLSSGIPLLGTIKSVDLLSRTIQTVDGTLREIRGFVTAGDSIFWTAPFVIYSGPQGTGYGEQVYRVSGNPVGGSARIIGQGSLVAVSPDRRLVATLSEGADTLELVSLNDNIVRKFPLQETDWPLIFSPDSKQIFFRNGRLLNIANGTWTGEPIPPYSLAANSLPGTWTWTQNGFFSLSDGSEDGLDVIMLNNLNTGTSTVIWRPSRDERAGGPSFAWSADGKKFAFTSQSGPNTSPPITNLYVCNIQSGTSALITTVQTRLGFMSFSSSPDGNRIAYAVKGDIYFSDL